MTLPDELAERWRPVDLDDLERVRRALVRGFPTRAQAAGCLGWLLAHGTGVGEASVPQQYRYAHRLRGLKRPAVRRSQRLDGPGRADGRKRSTRAA